ncbi:MAG: hypothetical protein GC192_24450 [Bacteroidetes bacterium]|nr:hypothetical protein [Bacteroidota bacterium]
MNQINFRSQLTFREFLKASFYISYRQPAMLFIAIFGLFILVSPLIYHLAGVEPNGKMTLLKLALGLYLLAFVPLIIYFKCRRAFNSKSRVVEPMDWMVDYEWINVKGTSFETKMTWEKVLKVLETKEFFFVYQSKIQANIISKREMSPAQIQGFRSIVKGILGLKDKLRED